MRIKAALNPPRPLNFRIEKRIGDCGAGVWEKVARDAPLFMRAPFLRAFEETLPETLELRYGVLSDQNDVPVVVMVGHVLTLFADRIPPAPSGKPRPKLLQSAMARIRTRVFMWGNFMGWGYSGIAFAPGVDRVHWWPLVAEAIDRAHGVDPEIASVELQLVLDISDVDVPGARNLEKHFFRSMPAEPDMVLMMDPEWKSFDDYRAALKSKYRKASLEMDKELAAANCVIENISNIDECADELIDLHLQVHEQSINRFVTLKREFIPALARHLGDRFICTVIRQDSRILGFITTLIDGDTAIAYVVGHDAQANRVLPVYLRLLQTAIEDGIRHQCQRVTYGRTALEPKARLGAVAVPLTIYGRHKNPMIGPLLTPVLQQMAPKSGPPPRSPFKSATES